MTASIREMNIQDYKDVFELWDSLDGIGLSGADSKPEIAGFLEQNPGLSFVAHNKDQLIGAVLCGSDDRRGYIYHLAVHPSYRYQGLGRSFIERCLDALHGLGIQKCHLFVFTDNHDAKVFWKKIGWLERDELTVMSKIVP